MMCKRRNISFGGVAVLPIKDSISFTRIDFCSFTAGVALNITAPVEFAIALPDSGILVGIVTPSTAHQVTTVIL